jgi:hypothetical protein
METFVATSLSVLGRGTESRIVFKHRQDHVDALQMIPRWDASSSC